MKRKPVKAKAKKVTVVRGPAPGSRAERSLQEAKEAAAKFDRQKRREDAKFEELMYHLRAKSKTDPKWIARRVLAATRAYGVTPWGVVISDRLREKCGVPLKAVTAEAVELAVRHGWPVMQEFVAEHNALPHDQKLSAWISVTEYGYRNGYTGQERQHLLDRAARARGETPPERPLTRQRPEPGPDTKPAPVARQNAYEAPKKGREPETAKRRAVEGVGHSITAVLRWCGKAGWTREEARRLCEAVGKGFVSDTTIGIQLKSGQVGKNGSCGPAPVLTKDQENVLYNAIGKTRGKSDVKDPHAEGVVQRAKAGRAGKGAGEALARRADRKAGGRVPERQPGRERKRSR